jgi:hypothetical protein
MSHRLPERSDDITVYLVLNDYGKLGSAYVETDPAEANRESIIRNFLSGQYGNAVQVVAFNTAEGWSWDVSEDIAREILQRTRSRRKFGRGYQAFHRPACSGFHAPRSEPSANQPGRPDRPPQARFREAACSAIGAAQGDPGGRSEKIMTSQIKGSAMNWLLRAGGSAPPACCRLRPELCRSGSETRAVTRCKLAGGHPTLIFRRAPGAYMPIAGGYTWSLQCPPC